jgi:hypothetical protein
VNDHGHDAERVAVAGHGAVAENADVAGFGGLPAELR